MLSSKGKLNHKKLVNRSRKTTTNKQNTMTPESGYIYREIMSVLFVDNIVEEGKYGNYNNKFRSICHKLNILFYKTFTEIV